MESPPEMPAIHPVLAVAGLALPAINPALAAARLTSTLHNTAKFADQNQAVWKDYHDIKDGDEARFIASATSSCISMKGLFESSVFELKEEDANGFRAVGSSKRTIKKQKIIPKRQRFGESRSSKQNQCQVYHYEAFYSSPITRGHEEKLSLSSSCDPCPCIDFSILMQNAKGEGSQPPEACNIIDVHGSSCKDLLNQVDKHRINEIATSSKIGAKPIEISQQYTSSKLTSKTSSSKDRHSKVATARGLRDRRVRLSPSCALQLFDIQDKLGFDQPSKAVDWLLDKAKHAIEQLPHTVNNSSLINMDDSLISTSIPYYKYYNSNPSSPKVSQKPSLSSNSNDESLELINHSPNYPLKSQTTSNLPIHCNLRGCESLSLSLSSMSNRSNDLVVGNDGEGQKPITLPSKPTRKESRDKARERARKRSSSKTSCDDQVISHTQFSLEL